MITQKQADEAVRNTRRPFTFNRRRRRLTDAHELAEAFQAGRLLPDVIRALQRVENPVGVVFCEPEIETQPGPPDGQIDIVLKIGLTL